MKPLCVCRRCLSGIESKEGPQQYLPIIINDEDDAKCDWCGEDGNETLYVLN